MNVQPKVISKGMTEFVFNEKYRWYEGTASGVTIILSTDKDTGDCHATLKVFESYETVIRELDSKLKKHVTQMLLSDANEWRADEGEFAISEKEFAEMIFLKGLTFNRNGTVDAFYDDGSIFAGHSIVAYIDVNGAITGVEIAG